MRDIYTESLVPIIPKPGHKVLSCFCWVGIGLSLLMLYFHGLLALLPLGLFYLLLRRSRCLTKGEYDYVHTNELFDVDLVVDGSSRKTLISVDLNEAQLLEKQGSSRLEGYASLPVKDYSGGSKEGEVYVLVCSSRGKSLKLLLCLNEKMYRSLKDYLSHRSRGYL